MIDHEGSQKDGAGDTIMMEHQDADHVVPADIDMDVDVESMTRFLHSRAVDVRTDSWGGTSLRLCQWPCASLS